MFGDLTHRQVQKNLLKATGIEITTRTIAKLRRGEPAATERVKEMLAEKNHNLNTIISIVNE